MDIYYTQLNFIAIDLSYLESYFPGDPFDADRVEVVVEGCPQVPRRLVLAGNVGLS